MLVGLMGVGIGLIGVDGSNGSRVGLMQVGLVLVCNGGRVCIVDIVVNCVT